MSEGKAHPTYALVSPDGQTVPATRELFEALNDFSTKKSSGSILLSFRNGGIAGIKASFEKTYK